MISLESILLPYQRDWIADRAAVKVYEKSRRIGITWSEAADAALDAGTSRGSDWWYIGYNHEMALEFVEAAAGWARRFNQAAPTIEQVSIEDEDKDILAYRIRFASGHKIVALSSRPSNLRGKQGVAIIDEAAFHDDLMGLLKAALALTMWGGRIHVISTRNGAANPFNQLVIDIRAGRNPIRFIERRSTMPLHKDSTARFAAIAEDNGVPRAKGWRAEFAGQYGSDAEEELFCTPSSRSGMFLPSALIEGAMKDEIPVLRWHCHAGAVSAATAFFRPETPKIGSVRS